MSILSIGSFNHLDNSCFSLTTKGQKQLQPVGLISVLWLLYMAIDTQVFQIWGPL